MATKILIFDFDGTVADTVDAAVKIYNKIAAENNYRMVSKEDLVLLRNMSAMDAVRYFDVSIFKLPFLVNQVRTALKQEVPNLKPVAGISEPLVILKNKGYKLFIVSTNSTENIESFLSHNEMSYFDGIYAVSDIFGKHSMIDKLIKDNSWDKTLVTYIGDEVRDIEAAKKSGVTAVAVTWGYNTEEVLAKNNPDRLINNPLELSSL